MNYYTWYSTYMDHELLHMVQYIHGPWTTTHGTVHTWTMNYYTWYSTYMGHELLHMV